MIVIHDNASYIPSGDVAALQSESLPFDVHILTEDVPNRTRLENDAHAGVTGANVMVLAIDPVHHHVECRFGSNTGVKVGDFDSIARAGNAHFHAGEVRQGIEAVLFRAKASAETSTAISQSSVPVVVTNGMSGGEKTFIVLLFAGVALTWWYFWRRAKAAKAEFQKTLEDNQLEMAELRTHNVENMLYDDASTKTGGAPVRRVATPTYNARRVSVPVSPPVGPSFVNNPVYAPPVVVQQNDGLLEGMLIGEAMADRGSRTERVVEEREVVRERSRSSDDAGGGGSDWGGSSTDYTRDDSPSYDSGGSSSDYDSGGSSSSWDSGSSDSGSSGGDSGGGGSDW